MAKFKDYKPAHSLFPLDISSLIPENHLVRQIDKLIEQLPEERLHEVFSNEGCPAYHPKMMLKVIIYAYSTKNYSCRNIASMLRQDITYMWLAGMQTPDFNTVNRFRSVYLKDILDEAFTEVLLFLHEYNYIKFENYFIDGSKLEADAGKYTHVWRKNTERYKAQVQARVKKMMEEIEILNQEENILYKNNDLPELGQESKLTSQAVNETAQKIAEKLAEKGKTLKKKQKRSFESRKKKLEKEAGKLQKYEQQEDILNGRNSYSKTDTDASMMRMKGSDELRPGYNIQLSSENQFVVNYTVSQNASDSADFKAHAEKLAKKGNQFIPLNYVGDAGYGSEENYEILESMSVNNYFKFGQFHNENKKKYKENIFRKENFPYNESEDFYLCPNNKKLIYTESITRTTRNGYQQNIDIYTCENCKGCPLKKQCTKAKGNRRIQINKNLDRHKATARKNLKSEQGIELRKRRGWEIETFFGDLKHNQKYKRISLRGIEKANTELAWLALSYNIRKYTKMIQKPQKKRA